MAEANAIPSSHVHGKFMELVRQSKTLRSSMEVYRQVGGAQTPDNLLAKVLEWLEDEKVPRGP